MKVFGANCCFINFVAIDKVYGTVVSREDHLVRKDGGGFDAPEFEQHPERYASTFAIKVRLHNMSN